MIYAFVKKKNEKKTKKKNKIKTVSFSLFFRFRFQLLHSVLLLLLLLLLYTCFRSHLNSTLSTQPLKNLNATRNVPLHPSPPTHPSTPIHTHPHPSTPVLLTETTIRSRGLLVVRQQFRDPIGCTGIKSNRRLFAHRMFRTS